MNKINHIADLYLEQKKLLEKEIALEKKIKEEWIAVKESIRPRSASKGFIINIARLLLGNIQSELLTSGLSYVAGFLIRKLLQKNKKRITHFFA